MKKMAKQGFSLLVALSMVLSMFTVGALAEEESPQVLICGKAEHTHSEECQKTCDIEEHTHGDNCVYCDKEEHTHSAECCTITDEGHDHTEGCICDKEAHTHSAECCTLTAHTHSEECQKTCDIEAHTHTDTCYAPAVARVGEDYYATLQAAVNALGMEAGTVVLLDDASKGFSVAEGQTVTVDLAGYTLNSEGSGYVLVNRGTLTLKNGSVTNESGYGVANLGMLTMDGVAVTSYDCGVTNAAGTTTVENCTVTVTAPSSGQPYGVYGQGSGDIKLTGTTVRSEFVGIYTSQNETIHVTAVNCEIYGGSCAAVNQWGAGTVTVDHCALTSDSGQVVEHNAGKLDLKNGTSLYAGDTPGSIGGKNPKNTVTMDDTVVIDEGSRIRTAWTDYVTSVTENDYAVDETAKTVSIKTPAGLAWWAKQANSFSFNGYTVQIENDLDMGGYAWNPIKNGKQYDGMTLDGQGHSIRNLVVPRMSDYGMAFIGDTDVCTFTIKDLTFDHAIVGSVGSGNIVGVVLGYSDGGTITLDHVNVINSKVNGFGKVGGLVGMAEEGTLVLDGCSVTDTTISGAYSCGGLVGLNQKNVEITNCTAAADWDHIGTGYVCYTGDATRYFDTEDMLANAVNATGIYWKGSTGTNNKGTEFPVLFAAWGDQYTDYQQYLTYEGDPNATLGDVGFIGLCHTSQPHTELTWSETRQPSGDQPGIETGVCGIGVCNEVQTREFWNVTFDNNGEKMVARVTAASAAARPADPTRSGYTFSGWTLDGEAYDFSAPVNNNIELVAQWTRDITYYTLTINYVCSDGAAAPARYRRSLESGSRYNVTSPALEGYTPDQAVVSGRLTRSTTITVTYTPVRPEPTAEPTVEPTVEPTAEPTVVPTAEPTVEPTVEPTAVPTAAPTAEPTAEPTVEPTAEPTPAPTEDPGEEEDLGDEDPPLAEVPETGDGLGLWTAVALAAAAGLVWAGLTRKREKAE